MKKAVETLSFLEADILKTYKNVKEVEEKSSYCVLSTEKELYESNSEYKQIVDEWEGLQKEISPKVLELYRKVLALRAEWILKD
ncbi:hypothetical protein EFE32_06430 [Lactococcus lactis subsp. lactis]|jgi:hypothetical protein|uniref:hypothetical protein n=1 Tax=Lactococcus lactis TaxID=1358 RepID=UPI00223C029A|nr:hypothetical protein [Lactococcus lactis]MCT0016485.1 hypothetical protein [Lactococcus lactis subsp. lactis]